jgi:hypothetical protein
MAAGYVYILVNPAMPGMLKIGMTRRTPEERARELSRATGVPVPFRVAFAEYVRDCERAERLIHRRLDRYRANQNREFFSLPLVEAKRVLAEIADEVQRAQPGFSMTAVPEWLKSVAGCLMMAVMFGACCLCCGCPPTKWGDRKDVKPTAPIEPAPNPEKTKL